MTFKSIFLVSTEPEVNQHDCLLCYAEISGTANPDAILSFHNEATGDRIRAGRNDNWFHTHMPLSDNSASTISNSIRMTGVLPGQGTGGVDLINTNQTITLSAMKTPEIFDYDDDGNLLADGRFDYTWNAENRLVEVDSIAGVSPVIHAEYAYDHQGRRISKTVNGEETSTFLWNGNYIIHEKSASKTNIYCWGQDDHLVSATLSGTNVFYSHDGNKNVTDLVDATGTLVAHYEFDPYGNINVKTGVLADVNPFRFSNDYHDEETGLITYLYRPYNPVTGSWMNRDPIGTRGGLNVYGFVGNSPNNRTDYLGLSWWNPFSWFGGDKGCERKKRERQKLINSLIGGIPPSTDPGCVTLTIIVKLPDPCAGGLDGKGLGGHTGLGIGDDYYDYGPDTSVPGGSNITGRPGDQWWDDDKFFKGRTPENIGLSDIVTRMPYLAHNLDVFYIRMSVCKQEAGEIRKWWEHKYSNLGTYRVWQDQCTSCVRQSLEFAGLTDSNALKPISFLEEIAEETHKCGSVSGQSVEVIK